MCPLEFGKQRTDRKACDSEQTRELGESNRDKQVRSALVCSVGQRIGKRESFRTSLKGILRTRIPLLPGESPWKGSSEGISKKLTDVPIVSERKH